MSDNLSDKANLANKRLAKEQVKKLLTGILRNGGDILFTAYAEKRMLERGITTPTVINVLERGKVFDGEEYFHEGFRQWRYRIETTRYRVVITFQIKNEVIVINAIDFTPHLIENVVSADNKAKKKGDR